MGWVSAKDTKAEPVDYDVDRLSVICYPDPRLRRACQAVTRFDDNLAALAAKMLELMWAGKGIGLAAPQVGVLLRMLVMNVTGDKKDDLVLVNPVIRDPQGSKEAEEGCLSLPNIHVQVRRAARCRVTAQDLKGNPIELEGEDLLCRVWQHETDHLHGILILDRMGPSDRIATRKTLKEMEATYRARVSA
ncbi:MAG TPA: peptide deformylase [Phycisphaerae bacterium]|nr:peptide deformylase [Phycisphaerae bacterium]